MIIFAILNNVMARLETQINQIYLINPESKKNSLVLYEEQLNNSLQLFIVAELWNMTRKTESNDLKKFWKLFLVRLKKTKSYRQKLYSKLHSRKSIRI